MFKCITRYTKFPKPLGQIHTFKRHFAKKTDSFPQENAEDTGRQMKSDLIQKLKERNESHKQHTQKEQSSDNNWLDVFYRDNSAEQTKRVDEIKEAFHRFSFPSEVENLMVSPNTSVLMEVNKLEDHYIKKMFQLKDEKLVKALGNIYHEILFQLNKYGNVDFKDADCEVVDSSQFSLSINKFITTLNSIEFGENGEVMDQDSKISELVKNYLALPVPRLMNLNHDQIAKFVDVAIEGFTVQECFQVAGSILKDIQESNNPLTYEEYERWIDKLYMAAQQNINEVRDAIDSVKDDLKHWKEELDMVIHNRALSFCLRHEEYDEFEIQLKNLQSSQHLPNRETLTLMMIYAAETQNFNCLLNVLLDFGIKGNHGLTYSFFPDDYAALFRSLIWLNQRDLAFFILNEISNTRTNYRKLMASEHAW
ncbi:unnamed protein product [Ambrosiozyma monospora]|uniref:Unnamed protein product n=1 Tax=Ambrosiozyma monospora TaxID=43982 RepID=A0ACB5T0Z7_AMBMO|nr:unnamed protein product [Ambrosiozyma monospora]